MFGKPDTLDRLAQIVVALVGLFSLANAAFMIVRPLDWYVAIPTVITTGPPNQHFIRDIGIAYAACGVMLLYAAFNLKGRWLAALTGGLWLSLHGVLHVYEVAAGICGPAVFWADAPGVLGPPLLVLAAVGLMLARLRIWPGGLPKGPFISAFDKASGGLSPFINDFRATRGFATEKFQQFMPSTLHRYDAPAELFHAARIGATLAEDCGPCAILAGRGALEDGLSRDWANAALGGKVPKGDATLAFAFGRSIAEQGVDVAALGDEIEAKYGRNIRLELALTAATVRAYPALKRELGYGQTCSATRLEV